MIVITGASGGLGSHLCKHLSMDDQVIGTYNTNKPKTSAAELYKVDVTNSESIGDFILAASKSLRRITLLNMAGVSLSEMGHKMSESTWNHVIDVNLKGTFLMCKALLPLMREQKWGRIINVSSIVGQTGVPGTVAYSASKAGLFGLTRTLAAENATKNITVNALALGYMKVGMIDNIDLSTRGKIRAKIPMKRFGHPMDVELAVRFLIDSDYVTGTTINVNGGLF